MSPAGAIRGRGGRPDRRDGLQVQLPHGVADDVDRVLQPHARVDGPADPRVVDGEHHRGRRVVAVGEEPGGEVAVHGAEHDQRLGAVHGLARRVGLRRRPQVGAEARRVVLVQDCLRPGLRRDMDAGDLGQRPDPFLQPAAVDLRAGEQADAVDTAEPPAQRGTELVECRRVALRGRQRRVQCGGRDARTRDVQRDPDVHGLAAVQGAAQDAVDLVGRVVRAEHGRGRGDLGVHPLEPAEVAVEERVVQRGAALHRLLRRHPDDVHDRHVLGVAAGDPVQRGQLADAVGGHDRGDPAPDAGEPVGGVGGVELVRRPDPAHAVDGQHLVEQGQVEVAGQPEHLVGPQLHQPLGEVGADRRLRAPVHSLLSTRSTGS